MYKKTVHFEKDKMITSRNIQQGKHVNNIREYNETKIITVKRIPLWGLREI